MDYMSTITNNQQTNIYYIYIFGKLLCFEKYYTYVDIIHFYRSKDIFKIYDTWLNFYNVVDK